MGLTVNPSSRRRPHTRPHPPDIEPRSSIRANCRSTTCGSIEPLQRWHRHQATQPSVVNLQQRVRQPTCPRTLPKMTERGRAPMHTHPFIFSHPRNNDLSVQHSLPPLPPHPSPSGVGRSLAAETGTKTEYSNKTITPIDELVVCEGCERVWVRGVASGGTVRCVTVLLRVWACAQTKVAAQPRVVAPVKKSRGIRSEERL